MNLSPRAIAALVATATAVAFPAAARATDYCVAPNTTCGGTNVASFEAALDAADNAVNADRIFLGATTYTAPGAAGYSYGFPAGPLEIIGAGAGQTVLTAPIAGTNFVLFLEPGTGSSIHDLTVRLPQNVAAGFIGLHTTARASRLEVVEAASQTSLRTGVRLEGARLEESTVTIGTAHDTAAVNFNSPGAALSDSTVSAKTAVRSNFGGTIERSVLHGTGTGLEANRLSTTLTDSLVTTTAASSVLIVAGVQAGQDTSVTVDGATLIGPGHNSVTGVFAGNALADAQTATASVSNTVIRGVGAAFGAASSGAGSASVNVAYSDYNPSGSFGSVTSTNETNLGDARFVNPAAGDYRLRFDSPLVDIGEPGPASTATDLAGGPRVVDGDAVAGARRDIGAFEYQARPPAAAIAGPSTATPGAPVSFSGEGSSDPDPGDVIAAYAWTVDGVAAGSGPTLGTVFATPGAHAVGLTVTDLTGRTGSATQTVDVAAAPDTTAPVVSNLAATPKRVKRGKRVRFAFTLDEAASVRLVVQRRAKGKYRRVKALTAAGKVGKNRVRGKRLRVGRYRVVATATDAAGNRSVAKRAKFRVVRPARALRRVAAG